MRVFVENEQVTNDFQPRAAQKTASNMWQHVFFSPLCFSKSRFMTGGQEKPSSNIVGWKSLSVRTKMFCFSLCSFLYNGDQEKQKNVCLFGANLHGKHWADTPRSPNHCGDSPQSKPSNLGQMWGQF